MFGAKGIIMKVVMGHVASSTLHYAEILYNLSNALTKIVHSLIYSALQDLIMDSIISHMIEEWATLKDIIKVLVMMKDMKICKVYIEDKKGVLVMIRVRLLSMVPMSLLINHIRFKITQGIHKRK